MLSRKSWIHQAGVIPSSLHQKVKFIIDDDVITISVDMVVITMVSQKVVEV